MADETLPTPAVTPEVVATPAVEAPVAPQETVPAPEVKSEPAAPAETVLGNDAPVVEPEVKTEEPKVEEIKPAEGAEPEAEKKETASQSDEPAPLPSYEAWTLPEGIAFDEARLGEVNKMLGEFEATTKVDHALMQTFGQQLIDRHLSEVKDTVERMHAAYQESWKKQTQEWRDAFEKDPEIGGNRKDTTTNAAREFIRRHGGTEEQQAEFRTLMEKTGLGNHPAMIRMLANANTVKAEGKPVPATAPPAQKLGKLQKFYGKKT